MRRELKRAESRDADLRARIDELTAALKELRKSVVVLSNGVQARLEDEHASRYAHLVRPHAGPVTIDHRDSARVLLDVLEHVGVDTRTFVDIGSGRGGGKANLLATRFGWRGVFVDASARAVQSLEKRLRDLEGVVVRQEVVTPGNVCELVKLAGDEPDLVSIDIDSYDYWVWRALDARPRIVVVEYNSYFGQEPVTVPFDGIAADAPKGYSGASLAALAKLGVEKGYVLLGCDHMGVNAFFARDDVCDPSMARSVEEAWRPSLIRTETDDVARDADKIRLWIDRAGLELVRV